MRNRGFTLIEILVSLFIFAIVVGVASQIVINTLRGTSKSEVGIDVKENADYALSVMERFLHSAQGIVSCTPQQITFTAADGRQTSFSCINVGEANSYIASGSARLTGEKVVVTDCAFTCSEGLTDEIEIELKFARSGTNLKPQERASFDVKTRILLRN